MVEHFHSLTASREAEAAAEDVAEEEGGGDASAASGGGGGSAAMAAPAAMLRDEDAWKLVAVLRAAEATRIPKVVDYVQVRACVHRAPPLLLAASAMRSRRSTVLEPEGSGFQSVGAWLRMVTVVDCTACSNRSLFLLKPPPCALQWGLSLGLKTACVETASLLAASALPAMRQAVTCAATLAALPPSVVPAFSLPGFMLLKRGCGARVLSTPSRVRRGRRKSFFCP